MRWLGRVALACGAVLALASGVWAHALLVHSDPGAGAVVPASPATITLSFTEAPDPSLSIVHVLDSTGRAVDPHGARAVPGQPQELAVQLGPLPNGVYTVSWRTVSAVDGHVAGGAFAFGVGVTPQAAAPVQPSTPLPSPLYVASRWALYLGLGGMLGAAWVWTIAFPSLPNRWGFLWGAWGLSAVGVVALGAAQAADAGVAFGRLLATTLGQALYWRALPIAVAGAAIAVGAARPAAQRPLVALAGAASAAAMLAHVLAGHAAANPGPWQPANVVVQWLHFASVGAWIGGLAALLVALPSAGPEAAARAMRRFSAAAALLLGLVAATGILRAVDEVGSLGALISTGFGRLVDLKAFLLLVLASLGAVNRYRNVPRGPQGRPGLLRVGATEVALGAVVFGIAGYLTGFAPPRYAPPSAAAPSAEVVNGHDFATSVRLRLEISPGTVGVDQFTASVADYDTGRPVDADRITLSFSKPDRPDIGGSTLDLIRTTPGTYRAEGTNLSLDGTWSISALVVHGLSSVEVPLTVTARSLPQTVRTITAPGQPTLYVIDLGGGPQLNVYLDPDKPGLNEVHVTFIDASGNELPIPAAATVTAAAPGKTPRPLPVRRFGPGHFIADAAFPAGTWNLVFTGTSKDGRTLQAPLTVRVGP
jgi:copper transport protein